MCRFFVVGFCFFIFVGDGVVTNFLHFAFSSIVIHFFFLGSFLAFFFCFCLFVLNCFYNVY